MQIIDLYKYNYVVHKNAKNINNLMKYEFIHIRLEINF